MCSLTGWPRPCGEDAGPPEEKTVYTDTLVILFIKELLQELGCGDSSSAQGPTSWLSVPQSDERRLQAHALSLSLSGLCPMPLRA